MKRAARHNSHRAFVTLLALALLGIVAAGLTSAALLMHGDVLRTQSARIDAQLRQLLLAGSSDAVARSQTWGDTIQPKEWSVTVPKDPLLEDATLSTRLESTSPNSADVHIVAEVAARKAEAQLRFDWAANQWKLTALHLGPPQ